MQHQPCRAFKQPSCLAYVVVCALKTVMVCSAGSANSVQHASQPHKTHAQDCVSMSRVVEMPDSIGSADADDMHWLSPQVLPLLAAP